MAVVAVKYEERMIRKWRIAVVAGFAFHGRRWVLASSDAYLQCGGFVVGLGLKQWIDLSLTIAGFLFSGGFWPVDLIESLADHWRMTDAIVSYLGKQLELLSSYDLAISTQRDKSGAAGSPDCPTTPSGELLV